MGELEDLLLYMTSIQNKYAVPPLGSKVKWNEGRSLEDLGKW